MINTWGQFYQHIYEKLLPEEIPNAQKDSQINSVFFALLGSACAKAARKIMVKLTPNVQTLFTCTTTTFGAPKYSIRRGSEVTYAVKVQCGTSKWWSL